MAYGDQVHRDHGQELVDINSKSVQLATWSNSQIWLVNIVPFGLSLPLKEIALKLTDTEIARFLPSWIPGLKFHAFAKQGKETYDKIRYWVFSKVKRETVRLKPSH